MPNAASRILASPDLAAPTHDIASRVSPPGIATDDPELPRPRVPQGSEDRRADDALHSRKRGCTCGPRKHDAPAGQDGRVREGRWTRPTLRTIRHAQLPFLPLL